MKVTYDHEVDVIRIIFSDARIEESDEVKPCTIIDNDKEGNIVGMEVLNASRQSKLTNITFYLSAAIQVI